MPLFTTAPNAGLIAEAAAPISGLNGLITFLTTGLTTLSLTKFTAVLIPLPTFLKPFLILFHIPQAMIYGYSLRCNKNDKIIIISYAFLSIIKCTRI